jgi:hypothetical protein
MKYLSENSALLVLLAVETRMSSFRKTDNEQTYKMEVTSHHGSTFRIRIID